jgi:uncharacterized repeat protein (TIGR01451 family)
MIKRILTATIVTFLTTTAFAQNVKLTNAVFKEGEIKTANGKIEHKLLPANVITPGDKIIFIMGYSNIGTKAADRVTITNPVPPQVSYLGGNTENEPTVSVDGGKAFGALATLTIKNADGLTRPARTSDVTHVRWQFARALTPGETGQVSYRGQLK